MVLRDRHVHLWHLADIAEPLINVRLRGEADNVVLLADHTEHGENGGENGN